ncbi:family 16 glycosylhydrolase [Desulfococcaceae bacterium HSG7]|nr:family 16 glycosylhydrolase [Desulfococcaceae bacterium HSG7]
MAKVRKSVLILIILLSPAFLWAATTDYATNSWDDAGGLTATVNNSKDTVEVSGTRVSQTAWGQGGVNYQAGATSVMRLPGNGTLDVDVLASGAGGAYGTGSGYKAFLQFWNDEKNFIALGIIHDPGPSPDGHTVMVEGAADGNPVGGYWGASNPKPTGSAHKFSVRWTPTEISWTIDGLEEYRMTFNIRMDSPSFSLLGAARMPGDSVSVKFQNINLSNPPSIGIDVPGEAPRATISADVNYDGNSSNTGWAVYLNLHDNNGNAIAYGMQADVNATATNLSADIPYLHYNRTEGGTANFSHAYGSLQGTKNQTQHWDLKYYDQAGKAIFFIGGNAVGEAYIKLYDRIFFQVEINGARNGDFVRADYSNVSIGGTWSDGTAVRTNGVWNDSFDNWGLNATRTGGSESSANFSLSGTVSGLPAGADWDTIETQYGYSGKPVAAVAMITEWWFNQ